MTDSGNIRGRSVVEAHQLFLKPFERQADHVFDGTVDRFDQKLAGFLNRIGSGLVEHGDERQITLRRLPSERLEGDASRFTPDSPETVRAAQQRKPR